MKNILRFCLSFSLLFPASGLTLPAFAQTTSDTFTLITCNRFWKTNAPVTGMLPYDLAPPTPFVSLEVNYNGFCDRYKFSPPGLADSFCPFGYNADSSYVNGVTVADLFKIQRHILGIDPLQLYSFQWFASDANQSGTVTGFDIVFFRNLILGKSDTLPGNYSWKAYSSYQVPIFPTTCTYEYNPALTTDTVDMIAVKIGDLDGDANPSGPYIIPQNLPVATLYTDDVAVDAGDTILAPVFITENLKFHGIQAGFQVKNPALGQIIGIGTGLLQDLNTSNFAISPGGLTFAWFNSIDFNPLQTDTTPLFFLKITAHQSFQLGDALQLWHDVTPALWIDENADVHPFYKSLATSDVFQPASLAGVRVHAPAPNPFIGQSIIRVDLENAEHIGLEVLDATGRLLLHRKQTLQAGTHTLEIPGEIAPAGGVLFYRLTAGGRSIAGKMVRM